MNRLSGTGASFVRAMAAPNLKRKASNTFSAVQDTFLSTKDIYERHKVVFTMATSVGSILTAWAGYSLRQIHQAKIDKRLGSIEKAIEQNQKIEHEEIKKIVNSGTISLTGCTATALTTLILGFGLGWRSGRRSAFNKIRREQQKLLHGHKNSQRWQLLRRPLSRYRSHRESHKTAEVRPGDDIHVISATNRVAS